MNAYSNDKKYFTVGEVIKLLGCNRQNLYNWEKDGKIPRAKRSPLSNYRLYTESEVEQIHKLCTGRV